MDYFQSGKNPVFFIAEIGGNHEGDFDYAKELLRLAIASGVDAVKFQIYSGDTLVSRIEGAERNRHFKRFELTKEHYMELAAICQKNSCMFMASVWDGDMLAWIDPFLPIHKIGSGDLTAYPLIEMLVATGKPIILSTGLATLAEVRDTVSFIDQLDPSYLRDKKLALLQCTSSYPCPDEDANLNAMLTLAGEFRLPVGYSDHTIGSDAALAAATMGAEILEMHFTDSREGKTFRDHHVSITQPEMRELLVKIRRVKVLQGKKNKEPAPSEIASGHRISFRRSVYARRDIGQGETFSPDNLTILRPAHGLDARKYDRMLGRKAKRAFTSHEVLTDDDAF